MIIDLHKTVIRKKLQGFYAAILFTLAIILILLTNIYENDIAGIDRYEFSIILASVYILMNIFNFLRDYNYIFYSDEKEKLILRYFSMNIFISKKSSIEIARSEFSGYSTRKSLLGLREQLFLYQKTKKGLARYPGVSITGLSGEEKQKLFGSLERLGRKLQ